MNKGLVGIVTLGLFLLGFSIGGCGYLKKEGNARGLIPYGLNGCKKEYAPRANYNKEEDPSKKNLLDIRFYTNFNMND